MEPCHQRENSFIYSTYGIVIKINYVLGSKDFLMNSTPSWPFILCSLITVQIRIKRKKKEK